MRRRRLIVSTIAVLLAGAALWLLLRPAPQPTYNGKTLTQWIDQHWYALQRVNVDKKLIAEAEDAIRHIGTNAIPTLLRLTATRDSSLKRLAAKFPAGLARRLGMEASLQSFYLSPSISPLYAQFGFKILGASASNAVPGLSRIMRTSDNPASRRVAAYVLGGIGPAAAPAIPDLVRNFNDPVGVVRVTSVASIFNIMQSDGEWRRESLPLLVSAANDSLKNPKSDSESHLFVFELLTDIGPDAKTAVPAIRPFLSSTNSYVSTAARRALEKIDPSAVR